MFSYENPDNYLIHVFKIIPFNKFQDSGLQNVQRLIKEKFELRAAEVDRGGGLRRLPPSRPPDRTAGTPTPSASERSYARSLEDLPMTTNSETRGDEEMDGGGGGLAPGGGEGEEIGPPSLPLMSSLPLARLVRRTELIRFIFMTAKQHSAHCIIVIYLILDKI